MFRYRIGFLILSMLCVSTTTWAQGNAVSAPVVPKMTLGRVPVRDVVAAIGKATRVPVVADKSVGNITIEWKTQGGSLPEVLKQLVALLPKGSLSRTVYLPRESADADGDSVVQVVAASDNLRMLREMPKPGTVRVPVILTADSDMPQEAIEILGKKLTSEKAQAAIVALDLKPVYLLTRPSAVGDPITKLADLQADGIRLWMNMTQEQRLAAAENQFDALMNMESVARRAMFGQQMQMAQMLGQKLQSLSEEQRRQFFLDMTDGKFDGTKPPAPVKP